MKRQMKAAAKVTGLILAGATLKSCENVSGWMDWNEDSKACGCGYKEHLAYGETCKCYGYDCTCVTKNYTGEVLPFPAHRTTSVLDSEAFYGAVNFSTAYRMTENSDNARILKRYVERLVFTKNNHDHWVRPIKASEKFVMFAPYSCNVAEFLEIIEECSEDIRDATRVGMIRQLDDAKNSIRLSMADRKSGMQKTA